MIDVFISYSSKDKAWVRGELLPGLEQAGLTAFIDFRDFTRGAASLKEMARGVKECRKTLLILTPDYVESEWCDLEGIMAQTLSPGNRDLRLIPILRRLCEKPLYVGGLMHIDFTDDADHDLAWRQLLIALGKPPEPKPPQEPQREQWFLAHPYPMPPNFTGRVAEREMLNGWLDADDDHPLLSLRALGGFGKSALAWHWLTHDVQPEVWPRVVWWSFYEGDASFDAFLIKTLNYLGKGKIDAAKISARDAVTMFLQSLHDSGTLLVLDGFERVLRAFAGLDAAYQGDEVPLSTLDTGLSTPSDRDCISPLAELFLFNVAVQPQLRSKLLLTTRLCPRVVEARGGGLLAGCRDEPLLQMQPADAVAFFVAQGIRGTHTEIETACEPYGYHPLSLCLLAGLIVGDFEQPGDIAAANRLDVSGDLVQRQHHVLEAAYDSLTLSRQTLLGRTACFRSPVAYKALKSLAESENISRNALASGSETASVPKPGASARRLIGADLDADLRDLVGRGLLHHDTRDGRFDLHPIVRRFAYDRLAAPDRTAAHNQLRDYFAAVPKPDKVTRLEDLAPVIELYHHTVRSGQLDEAFTLFRDRLATPLYYQFGAYQLRVDLLLPLFPEGEDGPPRLKDENAQAWTLNALANSYSVSGRPRRAVPLWEQQAVIRESQGHQGRTGLAIGLGAVASVALIHLGELRAAEANLRRSVALCIELNERRDEAIGHRELGRLLSYRGAYDESEAELTTALEMFEMRNNVQSQGIGCCHRALRELLMLRQAACGSNSKSEVSDFEPVLAPALRALELADEKARTHHPNERDYVRAHWLLGAAHRVADNTDEAEYHLHEALQRCRRINMVDHEANILIDMARLRAATGAEEEAQRLAEEALLITERSEYVLQGADAHLELAKLALTRGDRATAKEHAEHALRLATCDGPPDYTYKAAYDEATSLLESL